jgi:RNA polymerase sigma factor (sigma-70 family)
MEPNIDPVGPFETPYVAFLEAITQLRPRLHRYCSRMTGSVVDGEDVVQHALFEAYRKLDQFDDTRPLAPWLFRIAHNRCIDFLRRRGIRDEAIDGEAVVIMLRRGADTWTPYSVVRLTIVGQLIDRITDYGHCPWMISAAASVSVAAHS